MLSTKGSRKLAVMFVLATVILALLTGCSGDGAAPSPSTDNAVSTEAEARAVLQSWMNERSFDSSVTINDDLTTEDDGGFMFVIYQEGTLATVRIVKATGRLLYSRPDGDFISLNDWYNRNFGSTDEEEPTPEPEPEEEPDTAGEVITYNLNHPLSDQVPDFLAFMTGGAEHTTTRNAEVWDNGHGDMITIYYPDFVWTAADAQGYKALFEPMGFTLIDTWSGETHLGVFWAKDDFEVAVSFSSYPGYHVHLSIIIPWECGPGDDWYDDWHDTSWASTYQVGNFFATFVPDFRIFATGNMANATTLDNTVVQFAYGGSVRFTHMFDQGYALSEEQRQSYFALLQEHGFVYEFTFGVFGVVSVTWRNHSLNIDVIFTSGGHSGREVIITVLDTHGPRDQNWSNFNPEVAVPGVTLANFSMLREGMRHSEVVALFGSEGTLSSSAMGFRTYTWSAGFLASVTITFDSNGRVTSFMQVGLS